MKRRGMTTTKAVLIELLVVGAVVWSAFYLPGCATWGSGVHAAEDIGKAWCQAWIAEHPDATDSTPVIGCDLFVDAVRLGVAKTSPAAVQSAMVDNPPLSTAAAAALALPCIEPPKPIDDANPYTGPRSSVDRRLYPPIVMAHPHEGE
jgi:hypothetical protein